LNIKFIYAKKLFLLFIAIILSGCTTNNIPEDQTNNMEKINFTTSDGWKIVANYYPSTRNAVILLHQLGSDKSSYLSFSNELNRKGYAVLALDFRGHGESTIIDGKTVTWQSFSNLDFMDMTKDVAAARDWLTNKGYDNFAIVGASIGANTALNYGVTDSAIKTVVLLSPGLEYKGIVTNQTIRNFTKPIFIVASNEDTYSARSAAILYENAQGKKEIKLFDNADHGTIMFARTDLDRLILNWLRDNIS
jgi:alpha-beta hydrolase superfamily lysophospholipase